MITRNERLPGSFTAAYNVSSGRVGWSLVRWPQGVRAGGKSGLRRSKKRIGQRAW